MRVRIAFYLFVIALTLLDAVLLRSPNLLGKIGLLIYNYHYLRTFPKALLTVSLVVGVSLILGELIRIGVKRFVFKKITGKLLLILLMILVTTLLVRTGIDFSSGTYSQTGIRFRLGACLLPAILLVVFIFTWVTLPGIDSPVRDQPEQP